MRYSFSKISAAVSAALYLISLTQYGFYVGSGDAWGDRAYFLLLIGWLGVFGGEFAWFANPLLWLAWLAIASGKKNAAIVLAGLSLAVAGSFLFRETIITSEAPTYAKITGYGAGYWLWLSSTVVALIGAISTSRKKKWA